MEDQYGIIVFENYKTINGMFVDVEVLVNEVNIYGDRHHPNTIPTMKGLVIMIGNDNGKHNSGRIKVAKSNLNAPFKNRSKYYEVYNDNGKVLFKVGKEGDNTGLQKRKKEIEEFYIRNKEYIQFLKDNPNIHDEDEIYSNIKNTEIEFIENNRGDIK